MVVPDQNAFVVWRLPRDAWCGSRHTLPVISAPSARESAALFTDLPQMRVDDFERGPLVEYQSMRLSVRSTAVAARAGVLCYALLMVISAQALAQTPLPTIRVRPRRSRRARAGKACNGCRRETACRGRKACRRRAEAGSRGGETSHRAGQARSGGRSRQPPTTNLPSSSRSPPPSQPVEEKPAATDDKPAIVEQRPAPAEAKPAVAQDTPAAAPPQPAVPDAKPAVVEQKPAPAMEKSAIAHKKPAAKQKSAATPSGGAVRSKRAEHSKPVQPANAASKPRERTLVMVCTRFRTYNPSSGTYRGYDGRTYSCR